MELLTDKNKDNFEKWYQKQKVGDLVNARISFKIFLQLDFRFQIGHLLDYYDSLGIELLPIKNDVLDWWFFILNGSDVFSDSYKTRNEAYKEAFKQANILANKQLEH